MESLDGGANEGSGAAAQREEPYSIKDEEGELTEHMGGNQSEVHTHEA